MINKIPKKKSVDIDKDIYYFIDFLASLHQQKSSVFVDGYLEEIKKKEPEKYEEFKKKK